VSDIKTPDGLTIWNPLNSGLKGLPLMVTAFDHNRVIAERDTELVKRAEIMQAQADELEKAKWRISEDAGFIDDLNQEIRGLKAELQTVIEHRDILQGTVIELDGELQKANERIAELKLYLSRLDANEDNLIEKVKQLESRLASGVIVPSELVGFLLGENAFGGVEFGDDHPQFKGRFWWRQFLKASEVK